MVGKVRMMAGGVGAGTVEIRRRGRDDGDGMVKHRAGVGCRGKKLTATRAIAIDTAEI